MQCHWIWFFPKALSPLPVKFRNARRIVLPQCCYCRPLYWYFPRRFPWRNCAETSTSWTRVKQLEGKVIYILISWHLDCLNNIFSRALANTSTSNNVFLLPSPFAPIQSQSPCSPLLLALSVSALNDQNGFFNDMLPSYTRSLFIFLAKINSHLY